MLSTVASLLIATTAAAVCAQQDDAPSMIRHWYSYPPSGNRILSSEYHGSFPDNVGQFDVQLPSDVEWIIATYEEDVGGQFVATTKENKAYLIQLAKQEAVKEEEEASTTEAEVIELDYTAQQRSDQPPLVRTGTSTYPEIVQLPLSSRISPLSHPVPVSDGTNAWNANGTQQLYVYIDTSGEELGSHSFGDVVLVQREVNSESVEELDRVKGINAMPDGRIITIVPESSSTSTLLAVYGGSTTYGHCVLGDCIESSRLVLMRVINQKLMVEQDIQLPNGDVFEGICPMALPDGKRILTTVANDNNGAWLQTYSLDGNVVSSGPYIGWGWRHMLFYNNFGTSDKPHRSVVDVLTPHVRKILEFFDISQPTMTLQAQTSQYTTHGIGSRILDTAVSGDFNGDCINEAVVLDSSMTSIKSVQLVGEEMEATEIWSLPLPGRLTSNLAAVGLEDGSGIALAAASGSRVRFWLPTARHADSTNATIPNSSCSVDNDGDTSTGTSIEPPAPAPNDQNGRGKEGSESVASNSATSRPRGSIAGSSKVVLVVFLSMAVFGLENFEPVL